jgi:hypothetical protein
MRPNRITIRQMQHNADNKRRGSDIMKPNGNTIRRISPIHLKEPKQKGLTAFTDQERETRLTEKEELDSSNLPNADYKQYHHRIVAKLE